MFTQQIEGRVAFVVLPCRSNEHEREPYVVAVEADIFIEKSSSTHYKRQYFVGIFKASEKSILYTYGYIVLSAFLWASTTVFRLSWALFLSAFSHDTVPSAVDRGAGTILRGCNSMAQKLLEYVARLAIQDLLHALQVPNRKCKQRWACAVKKKSVSWFAVAST